MGGMGGMGGMAGGMGGMMGMGMAQEEADEAQDEANDAVNLANQALDQALDAENLAQQAQDDAAAEAVPVVPVDPNQGVQDEAEAVGDPHLKLSNGKKADLCCDGNVCKACPVLLQHDEELAEDKGNDLIARAHPDGASQIEFVDRGAGAFEAAGKLASVRFFVARAGNKGLRFRVYRPDGAGFMYIGQTEEINVPTANVVQEYTFNDQIPFLAGDYIGWSHTGNGNIPYDNSGSSASWNFGITNTGCGSIGFGSGGARTYSYMITTA